MLDISDQLLIRLAGAEVFGQGKVLFDTKSVGDWQQQKQKITAEVTDLLIGTIFNVQLKHTRSTLDAQCECAVSAGFDFCPHTVALAMVWREWLQQKSDAERGSDASRVDTYINSLSKDVLAERLSEIIAADNELTQQWTVKADRALGTLNISQLRKRINQLLPTQIRGRSALAGAAKSITTLLTEVKDEIDAGALVELSHHALRRIADHEQRGQLLDIAHPDIYALQQSLISAFNHCRWSATVKTAFVLELLNRADTDVYPPLPETLLAGFDATATTQLYQSITESWEKQLDKNGNSGSVDTLKQALVRHAGTQDDWQSIINIYAAHAATVADFLELTDLCLHQGQISDASEWLARAKENHRDGLHRNEITRLTVALHLASEDPNAAIEAQWALFKHSLTASDLTPLTDITSETDLYWQEKGEIEIRRQIDGATKQRGQAILYETLAKYYLDTGKVEAAAEIAGSHAIDADLLEAILQQQQDMTLAQPLYFRLVRLLVESGETTAYRRAVDLLIELSGKLNTAVQQREFSDAIRQIRQQLASKRNFTQWLTDAFPENPKR